MNNALKSFLSFVATSTLIAGFSISACASDIGIVKGYSVNLREQPSTSSQVLEKILKDSVVKILEQQDGWFRVAYNAKEGYMSSDYVSVLKDQEAIAVKVYGIVTASSLNIRTAASTDSEILTDLPRDSIVEIIATSGEFYQVKTGDITGFAHQDYIESGESAAIVKKATVTASSSLNMRAQASTSANVLAKLPSGVAVGVISVADGWCEIVYNGTNGYVSADYLQIGSEVVLRNIFAAGRTAYSSASSSVIAFAKQYIGTPYKYGGSSPKGFDCSGFVKYVFAEFGITLPRVSGAQYNAGTKVSKANLQPGDIVAFGGKNINHVGIYVGDGQFIHSPSPGKSVKIETLESGYYCTYYIGGCRIL